MTYLPVFEIGLWNAWIFLSAFLLQMLAMLFADKRVWKRSHVPGDLTRNTFEKFISITANLIWLIAMGYSIFLPLNLGTIWFYLGLFIFGIGVIIMSVATYNFITTPVDKIITKGIYQYSRHPMYLASFFICVGAGVATLSWLFLLFSIIIIYCFYHEARIEEKYCTITYSAYQEYMNRVPRWFGIRKNKM